MRKWYCLALAGILTILVGLRVAPRPGEFAMRTGKDAEGGMSHAEERDPPELRQGGIYDPNPDHLWDRLYRQFYFRVGPDGREYGHNALDPLLWPETEYLLSGASFRQAVALLDEFLSTNAERLIYDPLKRAVFQRDLWSVFDWLADTRYKNQPERRDLEVRLAKVIQRLALTPNEIRSLPDNYSNAVASKAFASEYAPGRPDMAFLPSDLFRSGSPWVCLGIRGGGSVAASHVEFFSGRSTFLVFMRIPEGRQATLSYLRKLRDFPQRWIIESEPEKGHNILLLNPDLPPFPIGTQFALLRQIILIDNQGKLAPTHLTESVQLRVYRARPKGHLGVPREARTFQDSFEFRLNRAGLFAGERGSLRPVDQHESEFLQFISHPFDPLESQPGAVGVDRMQALVMDTCVDCHNGPGLHSFISFSRSRFETQGGRPPELIDSSPHAEAENVVYWKERQFDWGLLQGLWLSPSVAHPRRGVP